MAAISTALSAGARCVYNKAADSVSAATFNQLAYESARLYKYDSREVEDSEDSEGDEEWTAVTKRPRTLTAGGTYEDAEEVFKNNREAGTVEVLRYKFSQKAAEALSEDFDVSLAYVQHAVKYYGLELARDLGRAVNYVAASDAIKATKRQFPILEDLQEALEAGVIAAKRSAKMRSIRAQPAPEQISAPASGVLHPRDITVSSNLDHIPIMGDSCSDSDCETVDEENDDSDSYYDKDEEQIEPLMAGVFPIESSAIKAEIEVVPSNPSAKNGLDDSSNAIAGQELQDRSGFFEIDLKADSEQDVSAGRADDDEDADEWTDVLDE